MGRFWSTEDRKERKDSEMPKGWTVKVLGAGLALVMTVGLAACGSGGSSQPEAAKGATPAAAAADKPAAKSAAKPVEKDAKGAPSLKDMSKKPAPAKSSAAVSRAPMNLVSNGTFTSWMKDGRPKGWRGSASVAARVKGEKPGANALQLKPSQKDSALSCPVKGALAGKTLTLAVTARVQDANALGMAVDYKTAAGPKTEFWYFSKSPSWRKETKKVTLPADAAADSVSVRLVLRNSAKPAEIAAVSLTPAS